jgi:hypothetical protein
LHGAVETDDHRREFWREAVTMALYLSLSLLAVLLAVPTSTATVEGDPVGLVFLTAVGLLVAHLLAFSISSRLVSRGVLDAQARLIAFAQIVGGLVVVALVTLPLLLFDAPMSLRIAQGLMLALVALVGFLAARQADVSMVRALVYVAAVVASVVIVLLLKAVVGH